MRPYEAVADGDDDGNVDAVGAWSSSLPDSSSGHAGRVCLNCAYVVTLLGLAGVGCWCVGRLCSAAALASGTIWSVTCFVLILVMAWALCCVVSAATAFIASGRA